MQRSYYTTPKPSRLMRLFWKAAGADRYILERSTYSDQIKYTCMGGIVVATGVMAAIAGGYGFYTIFEPKGSAIDTIKTTADIVNINYKSTDIPTAIKASIFGLIWGLIIFNIDRFIVTSTGKGDGTEAITSQELKSALPRIIMGTIIALTISKPVEIRMFKSEIDIRLHEEQLKLRKDYENRIDAAYSERLKIVEKDIVKVEVERQDLVERIKKAEIEHTNQLQGRAGAPAGDGKLAQALFNIKTELISELNNFDASHKEKFTELQVRRKDLLTEKDMEIKNGDKVSAGLDGLLERIKLCHEIAGGWISTFITLLFMAIELTPIFFKLMLTKGPYDYIDENIKELIKAENGIQVQYNYYKDKQGQERDLIIHHQVDRLINDKVKILEAQKELSDEAIGKWKEQQRGKMNNNLNDFIKEEPDNA